MKRFIMICSLIAFSSLLIACDNMNGNDLDRQSGEMNRDTVENNTTETENVTEQTTNQDDQEYMKSKMNTLDFSEIEIEVNYANNKEFEAKIDLENNQYYTAKLENDLNNEIIEGRKAFDHIYSYIEQLRLASDHSKEDVVDQVLNIFDLPSDYQTFDIEIKFHDGKKLEFEDRK